MKTIRLTDRGGRSVLLVLGGGGVLFYRDSLGTAVYAWGSSNPSPTLYVTETIDEIEALVRGTIES